MQLSATGDLFMETVAGSQEDSTDPNEVINNVFLPPKIESRPTNKSKVIKKTSHIILTTDEIIEQKRLLQVRKDDIQAKR